MMTPNQRHIINMEENWLSENSWSLFIVAWKPVLPANVKDRWFPCWSSYVTAGPPEPTCGHFPRHTRWLALTNQRRGGLQRFYVPSDMSDGLLLDFGTPLIIREEVCDCCCCCWWRPGRRDRGASCLPVITKAFWRRGPSKIRYSWSVWHRYSLSKHQEICQQTAQYESLGDGIDTWL